MDDDIVISLREIHKYYGDGEVRLHVLKGINLDIRRGEFIAITGASGSGKSTLLNLLGCLDRPTSGEFLLSGRDIARLSDDQLSTIRNEEIGFIFQSFNLISALNVLGNVQVPLLYGQHSMASQVQRCRELLASVQLDHRLDHKPSELSGGERQRVAIARALVNEPVLLLADEPTGNLDTKTGVQVLEVIERLHAEGRTILMITHDPEVAARAERIVNMRDGLMFDEAAA